VVKITIDGQEIEVEDGTTILEAAQQLGIKIPTLCYHKALPPYGACRLCLVEISQNSGSSSVQASCTYPAQEGLIVKTDTERVIRTRKCMAELLLARCPDSEEVRRIAKELGVEKPRIRPKNEDCLLCGLCVRMCRDRMGRGAIGFAGRGSKREIQPAFDVQSDVCQTCGACFTVCPTQAIKFEKITKNEPRLIPSEFDVGLRERPSIYVPYPQAVPNYAIIDKDHCVSLLTGECKVCQEFCDAKAINFDQQEEELKLDVGAVIVAPGYDTFDAKIKSEYGYGRYRNVVTSIEFERILSASGPFEGHLVRLSDKKEPKKIAFVQCVGSRDPECGNDYCSSVCCTYAIKEAIIAKEHSKNSLETTIFYMDIRTHGKGFDEYYERAKKKYGVRFVRAGVPKVSEIPEAHNLRVRYEDENLEIKDEEFDLVVLSVGIESKEGISSLAEKLGIKLDEYGFCKTDELSPLKTTKDGIWVCGAFSGPKDIPETVMQASGAAGEAMGLLTEARNTLIKKKEYPPEIDVRDQPPRIGVFICHCGINIGGYVDVPSVVEYAKSLPNVTYVEDNLYTCSQDTQTRIVNMIKEHKLNRVAVASCTPRTHEPLFQDTIREAGLNPHLFEMANIRDQCSWVHMNEPEEATRKAKDLVRMAVAKARLIQPLWVEPTPVIQKGFVIGGGVAGMVSTLTIAQQGFEVFIVEKEKELGGNARNIYYDIYGHDVQEYLRSLIQKLESNPLIHVYKSAKIKAIDGFVGNYKTIIQIENRKSKVEIEHGIIIVATGAKEYRPQEYLYGQNERVLTQHEFEKLLSNHQSPITNHQSVVMIQCVGSRDNDYPYCSRVCCTQAVKNSLKLLELNPQANIFILYRDVRTYGMREIYYRKARDKGVTFIRYDEDQKPELIVQDGSIKVSLLDPILKEQLIIDADLLVLSTGIHPEPGNEEIARLLKVPLGSDNFFLEAHVKLRPVDFATDGVFLAGMAHGPKSIDESIFQAEAAAGRASTILSKPEYIGGATIASVMEDLCAGCGICVSVCSYGALEIVTKDGKRISKVNEALCKGCGSCSAACPTGASQQLGFRQEQLYAMVEAALE